MVRRLGSQRAGRRPQLAIALLTMGLGAAACATPVPEPSASVGVASGPANTLTPQEQAQGWQLLFNGRDLSGWKGYRKDAPSPSWKVEGDAIAFVPGQGRGDLVTREQYGDFIFDYEWKISEGGNSGVIYRATEAEATPWRTGPEMQVLDDERHPDAKAGVAGNRKAGSLYDLIAATPGVVRAAGEWNRARIVARGNHLEHWMNGQKVLEVDVGSDQWKRLYQASKFKDMAGFGTQPRGHIVLQDHGDPVWFRNLKIRPLN